VLDPGYVFDLIGLYLRPTLAQDSKKQSHAHASEHRAVFLQIVCDHELFVSITAHGPIVSEGRSVCVCACVCVSVCACVRVCVYM